MYVGRCNPRRPIVGPDSGGPTKQPTYLVCRDASRRRQLDPLEFKDSFILVGSTAYRSLHPLR